MTDPNRISDDQHNNAPAPAQGEPFGYFRAEPFGWTDCSEDAEGAIALYEHPAHEKHWTENEPVRLPSARTDRVYLAGPMTGIAELNFPAFNQEAERLRAEGLQVLNPADHGIVDGADWADYLRHDIAGLASCERIHLLRGWTKSKGACLEMTIAKALGMTVTYQVDAEMEHNNAPAVPTDSDPTSKEQYRRMFVAACEALGAISDALGCDPEDGGAEPILGAVEELQISLGLSNGILGCLSAAHAVPQGWAWMTHPSRNNGQPFPVRFFEDGDLYFQPFDFSATEFEWSHRDDGWDQVALPATPAPAPAQEVATLPLSAEDVHAAFTKNFPKSRISQAWINFAADIAQAIAARAAKPACMLDVDKIGKAYIAALHAKGAV